jgi:DNA mismatch endonuclease (patch repair protein)
MSRSSRQHQRDTGPEFALRRELWSRGLRYRVKYPVPGIPRRSIDIAFPSRRVAVFVDDCFWHGCPLHGPISKSNPARCNAKLDQARGHHTSQLLVGHGWHSIRFWEHDYPVEAADFIEVLVRSYSSSVTSGVKA